MFVQSLSTVPATLAPGRNFYPYRGAGFKFNDCFGHSAFRIKDPVANIDLAYNYGMFNTAEPGFYTRFAMGTQDYYLVAYDFSRFLGGYQAQNRWIKEQVLNLTRDETQHVFEYLENNRKPETGPIVTILFQ